MHRNAMQSLSSYNLGSRQPPKCIMMGLPPNIGCSCEVEIFQNVEAMQAKEAKAKEKEAVANARKAKVGIGIPLM